MRRSSPAAPGLCIIATLAVVAACDKAPTPDPNQVLPVGAEALDLSSRPTILFQVFGSATEPKIMPIASIVGGAVRPIGLTRQGWRELDSLYLSGSPRYPVYVDNAQAGTVVVTRSMWTGEAEALYPLPGCTDLRPIGGASLELTQRNNEPSVELVAASSPLAVRARSPRPLPSAATINRLGRQYGYAIGTAAGLDREELDSLDFIARMIITGASAEPTLIVSFIDRQAGDVAPGVGHTSHVLALLDKVDTGYVVTYSHIKSGNAPGVEFQRVVDRVDANGDGIDELIIESWHYAKPNELVVLGFTNGQWHEILRASQNWCLDPSKPGAPTP